MKGLSHLFFPAVCAGCGEDIPAASGELCIRCLTSLPYTNYHQHAGNMVEKHFWGRLNIQAGFSLCHFNEASLIQRLLHEIKYRGNRELGILLGRLMGERLSASSRFSSVDLILPLPLFPKRERERGYNQSALLCEGMSEVTKVEWRPYALARDTPTATQTKKNRAERWQNMQNRFSVREPNIIAGRHVLLVDDVITTGATLEACGEAVLNVNNVALSISTLAYAV